MLFESIFGQLATDASAFISLAPHGLWPVYNLSHAPFGWPQYCGPRSPRTTNCEARPASAPPIEIDANAAAADNGTAQSNCLLLPSTLRALNRSGEWQSSALLYAWSALAAHEYHKHGACTPYSQLDYFNVVQQTHEELSTGDGAAAVQRAARVGYLRANELRNAFKADTGALPVLKCSVRPAGTPDACLLYTSPSPRDRQKSRMPSSA